jgi:hypothetical protein
MKVLPKLCCICSQENILSSCSKPGCENSFHLHCISYYFPELKYKSQCPIHQFKPLKDISKLLYLSNECQLSTSLAGLIKTEKVGKKQQDLTGNLFWFCISQQYFPYFSREKPEFSMKKCENPRESPESSWISKKISKISTKLETVTTSISSQLIPLLKQVKNCCKRPKPGENLSNSSKMPLNLQGKFIRNYEKIKINSFKHILKDYHNHISEEKIVCAVCDDGDSDEGNLIVICSNCEVPVHCSCYNISKLPDHDWLCDACRSESPFAVCSLCPIRGGALKQDKSSNWVHVTCARHLQGLSLKSFVFDSSKIDLEKFKLKCFSCGGKAGACVQCSHGRCATAFHVECRKDLLELENGSMFWLCPSHKASKLTRNVKQNKDFSDEFNLKIANLLFRKNFGEVNPPKIKKVKKSVNVESMKKKIVMEITQECILMKVFLNNKLFKTVKYLQDEDKGKNKSKQIDNLQDMKSFNALPLKVKRKDKAAGVAFMKSVKGEMTVKFQVSDEVLESPCKKRMKV